MSKWLFYVAVLVATACASSPSEPNPMASDRDYAELRRRVAESGRIQVIVGVRTGAAGDVRSAQDELIASLPADHVELVRRFDAIPFVVVRVDAEGLDALIASPLVTSIEEDVPSPSARP